MPGLFGIPTPEEIRAQIGKTGRERDLSLASLPAGRGPTAFASSLGRVAGRAAFGPTQEEQEAQKKQLVVNRVQEEASKQGITSEKNPVEFSTLAAKIFIGEGMQEAAANALTFATNFDKLLNVEDTALTNEVKQQFGMGPQDKFSDPKFKDARDFLERLQVMRNQRQPRVNEGGTPAGSGEFRAGTQDFLASVAGKGKIKVGEESFELSEFNEDEDAFVTFVSDLARKLQEDVKQAGGGRSLSANAARKKALDTAMKHTKVVGIIDEDIAFDVQAASQELDGLFPEGEKTIDFNEVKE